MRLIEHSDAIIRETFFLWVTEEGKTLSPYFGSKKKAEKWLDRIMVEMRKKLKK